MSTLGKIQHRWHSLVVVFCVQLQNVQLLNVWIWDLNLNAGRPNQSWTDVSRADSLFQIECNSPPDVQTFPHALVHNSFAKNAAHMVSSLTTTAMNYDANPFICLLALRNAVWSWFPNRKFAMQKRPSASLPPMCHGGSRCRFNQFGPFSL